MASRSFKPASYFSAATAPSRSPRPSFTRSSSGSSMKSMEESLFPFTALHHSHSSSNLSGNGNLSLSSNSNSNIHHNTSHKEDPGWKRKENIGAGAGSPFLMGRPTPTTSSRSDHHLLDNTTTNLSPERKRSQPIAIDLPRRDPRAVDTPLTGREGDFPGGYFPFHEDTTRPYKYQPFAKKSHQRQESFSFSDAEVETPSEMAPSALGSPVTEVPPKGAVAMLSAPAFAPDALAMPLGKYHPSNFKSTPSSSANTPLGTGPNSPLPFPHHNLTIPKSLGKRNTNGRPGHERKTSDVKRKIQQYQRDMALQAGLGSVRAGGNTKIGIDTPSSPLLVPTGSPGPITPFELEESEGYLVAGNRRRPSLIDQELVRQRESEVVDRLIENEGNSVNLAYEKSTF